MVRAPLLLRNNENCTGPPVPECTLKVVIFDRLYKVGGTAQTNLLVEWVSATQDDYDDYVWD